MCTKTATGISVKKIQTSDEGRNLAQIQRINIFVAFYFSL